MRYFLFAIIVGIFIGFQSPINSALGKVTDPKVAAIWNNLLGLSALVFLGITTNSIYKFPTLFKSPPILLIGGLLGASIVYLSIITIPKIGAANFIAFIVLAQLLSSLFIDYLGLFGLPKKNIDISRIIGVLFLLIGAYLIKK
ncbi:DMT family transporter [Caldicellulosiruptoraceae bacterium PP1]